MTLPVLTFHSIDEIGLVTSCPPAVFAHGLEALARHGFLTLDLEAIAEHLEQRRPFPERALALTFDDGHASVYEQALPVLQRLGMKATVFLTVGDAATSGGSGSRLPSFEGRPLLSWTEIEEMQRAGLAFGAHTLCHPDLTRQPAAEVERQILESKARIEDRLGAPVLGFAYPYGRHDANSRALVAAHFRCGFTDRLGFVTPSSDRAALSRIDAYYLRSQRRFALVLSRSFPWYIRARGIARELRRALHEIGRRGS